METSAPMVDVIVNNVLLHSNSHINKMLPQIIHILRFCLVDSLPQILLPTVLRSGLYSGQNSGNSYRSLSLLHFRTGERE